MAFKQPKSPPIDRARAEAIAAEGLSFLAEDANHLTRFLADTGIDIATLRDLAGSQEVLGAVLEHLEGNESLLMVFAAGRSLKPEAITMARIVLQGSASQ